MLCNNQLLNKSTINDKIKLSDEFEEAVKQT